MTGQKIIQLLIVLSIFLSAVPLPAAEASDSVPLPPDGGGFITMLSENAAVSAAPGDGGRPTIVFIHGGRSEDTVYLSEVAAADNITPHLNLVVMEGGSVTGNMDEILAYDYTGADVVIFHNLAAELIGLVLDKDNFNVPSGKVIMTTAGSWTDMGYVSDETLNNYLDFRIRENYYNAVLYIGKTYAGLESLTPGALKTKPIFGIFHPDAGADRSGDCYFSSAEEYMAWYRTREIYDDAKPMIAILLDSFKSLDEEDNSRDGPMVFGMIRAVESRGANVLFATYAKNDPDNLNYLTIDGKAVPEVIAVTTRGGRLPTNASAGVGGTADLEKLDVVTMHAVRIFGNESTKEAWSESMSGVPANEIPYIAMGEMDGLIEPIVVLVKEYSAELGMNRSVVLDRQMNWFIDRAMSWSALNTTPNSEKVVVIPYYAADAGKASIGADTDYYLNAPASLINLFKNMSDDGYDLGGFESAILSAADPAGALADQMVEYGHNVGTWAPGMIEKMVDDGHAVLVPEEAYTAWFETLDSNKKEEVTSIWGSAPGDVMVYTDKHLDRYIVIPTIRFGNVILAPNPMRGRDQSAEALANTGAYPPTHQCLAFYYYFNNVENDGKGVDAYLPLYSNIAVMPGRDVTLAADDWGAVLMQDKPIIHVLPVDAKGTMDARRANMQIISYLTPALVPAGLSEALTAVKTSVDTYKRASADDETTAEMKADLAALIRKNNIDAALDVAEPAALTDEEFLLFLTDVSAYLDSVSGALVPAGTHTLGETPSEADMRLMAAEMHRTDSSKSIEAYMDLMNVSAAREIPAILGALSAGYTPSNLAGNPVSKPDVLPSGGGLYNHDTRTVPTKEAWTEGVRLVDDMIAAYQKEHGKDAYPDKTAYLLWAIETSRNGGVLESQILYMLGVKPVWNDTNKRLTGFYDMNSGKVVSGAISPNDDGIAKSYDAAADNLNRPRLDVLVVTSGSYRDMYGSMLQNITAAVAYASSAEDPDGRGNYVRDNSEKIYRELLAAGNYTEEEAKALSQARIFAPAPGEYTPGIENMVGSGQFTNEEIAQKYIDRMGYIYGGGNQGTYNPDVLAKNLAGVKTAVFSRSSYLYGVLDHNMAASYFGGLSAAVDHANGGAGAPDSYIMNLRHGGKIQTLSSFLNEDLSSRYLNEKWIENMMAEGYTGTTFMNEFAEALRLWDATTDGIVTTDTWQAVYETYMADKTVRDYLKNTNAYAYQSLVGNLLQSDSALALSEDVRDELVKEFIQSVAQNGVTCCHHTCGNPAFTNFVVGQMSAVGADPADQQAFMRNIRDARIGFTEPNPASSSSSSGGVGKASVVSAAAGLPDAPAGEAPEKLDEPETKPQGEPENNDREDRNDPGEGYGTAPGNAGPVSGYQLIEKTLTSTTASVMNFISNPTFSSSSVIVIALVVLLVAVVFYGFRKKGL